MDNDGIIMAIENLIKGQDLLGSKLDNVQKDVTDIKVGMQCNKDKLDAHDKLLCDQEGEIQATQTKVDTIQSKIDVGQHQSFLDVVKWYFSQPKKKVLWNSIILFIAGLIIATFILFLIFILGKLGVLPQFLTGLFKVI